MSKSFFWNHIYLDGSFYWTHTKRMIKHLPDKILYTKYLKFFLFHPLDMEIIGGIHRNFASKNQKYRINDIKRGVNSYCKENNP